MKCVKLLTIAALLASASAVSAGQPAPAGPQDAGMVSKAFKTAKGYLVEPYNMVASGKPAAIAKVAGGTVIAWYALSKAWGPAQKAWEKCRLNKITDKVEDSAQRAKEKPRSKDGALWGTIGAATIATLCWKLGLLDKVPNPLKGKGGAPAPAPAPAAGN